MRCPWDSGARRDAAVGNMESTFWWAAAGELSVHACSATSSSLRNRTFATISRYPGLFVGFAGRIKQTLAAPELRSHFVVVLGAQCVFEYERFAQLRHWFATSVRPTCIIRAMAHPTGLRNHPRYVSRMWAAAGEADGSGVARPTGLLERPTHRRPSTRVRGSRSSWSVAGDPLALYTEPIACARQFPAVERAGESTLVE